MNTEIKGVPFSDEYQKSLEEKFCFADVDPEYGHRLFFENSGGSLHLRKAVEAKAMLEAFPDCPERNRGRGYELSYYVAEGTKEIMEVIFGAHSGALISELSASQCMFQAVTTIMENAKWGTNAVTTLLEHPSAHDAVEYACVKTGREFRTIPANPETGGIEVEEVLKHVDKDTVLVSIMAASNISGNIMDIKEISRRVHEINPDIYVVADAVQHAPHALIDVEDWDVDVSNFAPYKFFSVRGCGYAYVSPRVATMFHPRLKCKDADIWQLGTPAPGNFAAMMEVIRYVAEIGDHFEPGLKTLRERYTAGMNRIHLQERALLYRMLEGTDEVPGLRHIPGVLIHTDIEDLTKKDLIVAMGIQGISLPELAEEYMKRGITVFERMKSSPYSERIISTIGVKEEGAIRVSPLHCYGTKDIDEYLKITKDIAESVRR
ncbi:Selenocysteine lyase/Cysteine desulfurase [Eubacterium pyruvativorans]|uniref:Selenocysteine lyase/Cysteine desulfurase n=1 Tax=Eubacterium pyruvativorans TaxID=155865 RepID=A0A1I7G2A5_9FIRM|nr:aminotransferase class V-fold PLP-dependent enzyme [Eubacterium pyruvativorans]SFN99053.1 Selenocysteine lyase/Cysteine desulfurase [Eubacterium pyruvativorans]SFU42590.1 Selenocysteine lyase/Cysteine desulfurase [Eubacterium pyruvativorans]